MASRNRKRRPIPTAPPKTLRNLEGAEPDPAFAATKRLVEADNVARRQMALRGWTKDAIDIIMGGAHGYDIARGGAIDPPANQGKQAYETLHGATLGTLGEKGPAESFRDSPRNMGTAATPRKPDVLTAMDGLGHACSTLSGLLDDLNGKLGPVTRQPEPSPANIANAPDSLPPSSTALVSMINDRVHAIRDMQRVVRDLLHRLEV